jgi:hypothetical protein
MTIRKKRRLRRLVALAAAGKMTPEHYLSLPKEIQNQLLPVLTRAGSQERPTAADRREYRKTANEIANSVSWGLFTAELQQLGLGCLVILIIAGAVVVFILAH